MERVKNEKLIIKPEITPNGRTLPPVTEEDSTMGKTGKMHGERTVTNLDKAANANKIAIKYISIIYYKHSLLPNYYKFDPIT